MFSPVPWCSCLQDASSPAKSPPSSVVRGSNSPLLPTIPCPSSSPNGVEQHLVDWLHCLRLRILAIVCLSFTVPYLFLLGRANRAPTPPRRAFAPSVLQRATRRSYRFGSRALFFWKGEVPDIRAVRCLAFGLHGDPDVGTGRTPAAGRPPWLHDCLSLDPSGFPGFLFFARHFGQGHLGVSTERGSYILAIPPGHASVSP